MNCGNCYNPIRKNDNHTLCTSCKTAIHTSCAINDNGTYCDLCYSSGNVKKEAISFELPSVIRRSHIERYKSCPYAFYLEVIKGIEAPPTIYTQLGVDLHDEYEKHARNRLYTKQAMLESMQATFRSYGNELFGEVDKDAMYERMVNSIDGYYTIAEDLPQQAHVLEETIEFSIGDDLPNVQFTMDRIDLVDGELEVLDWKTGKVMTGKKFTTDLQAPLYIYGVKQKYGLPVRKFTFYYVNEGKFRVFERESENVYVCRVLNKEYRIDLIEKIKEVQSMFARIRNHEFNVNPDTRSMHFTCKMCFQKQNGNCRGADEEVWHIKEEWGL